MAQGFRVAGDTPVKRLGDFLPVLRPVQIPFVPRVAQESDFSEHGGHGGADQNHKRRAFDASIMRRGVACRRLRKQRRLYVPREGLGLGNLIVQRDRLNQV